MRGADVSRTGSVDPEHTTYTLSCKDLSGQTVTKQAKVRIIPTWQEK